MVCDAVVGFAGSVALAVLTRGATMGCAGLFMVGEEAVVGLSLRNRACRLQKIVFANGIMGW